VSWAGSPWFETDGGGGEYRGDTAPPWWCVHSSRRVRASRQGRRALFNEHASIRPGLGRRGIRADGEATGCRWGRGSELRCRAAGDTRQRVAAGACAVGRLEGTVLQSGALSVKRCEAVPAGPTSLASCRREDASWGGARREEGPSGVVPAKRCLAGVWCP